MCGWYIKSYTCLRIGQGWKTTCIKHIRQHGNNKKIKARCLELPPNIYDIEKYKDLKKYALEALTRQSLVDVEVEDDTNVIVNIYMLVLDKYNIPENEWMRFMFAM